MRLCMTATRVSSRPESRVVLAARQDERPRRRSGGEAPPRHFTPPERLLKTGPAQGSRRDTVYTLRLSTGTARGGALTDPEASVLVCLVGGDGSALLHRVHRVNDPELTEREVRDICASIDERQAGVSCAVALHAAARQRHSGAGPRLRFQEGAVDEVSFCAPELGPLAALLVGPECGSWLCEEVDVSSSRTGHTDRFVCRESLGEGGTAAAYLRPVPRDAVVYGSGDAARALTREQAAAVHAAGMVRYGALQGQLTAATAVLVAVGSGLAYAAGGRDLALPFALGGAGGMLYLQMLQAAADAVGAGSSPYAQEQGEWAQRGLALRLALGNPAVRLAASAGVLSVVLAVTHAATHGGGGGGVPPSASSLFQVQQIAASLLGFLCYKAALVGVAVLPPPEDGALSNVLSGDAGGNGDGEQRGY